MTNKQLTSTLNYFELSENLAAITGIHRGIEREALRINQSGRLSASAHPKALGSALTHKYITTDFSEALLEFITPASTDANNTLLQLKDIQKFTQSRMADEVLWPVSMPCFIKNQEDIALAQYGQSNVGKMKTLYREGLKNRYGSMMQAIAGVHFNISFPKSFWQTLQKFQNDDNPIQDFISTGYLSLIRNFKRELWLISYLFGASPALCSSFLDGKDSKLPFEKLGKGSLYLPYGTALRLGDLGYTNSAQSSLQVSYNNLDEYITGLKRAILTDSDLYRNIGQYPDGRLKQLNSHVLQIENEFYSSIRPKRNALDGETPINALNREGIEYIEVRALDVNPFVATGISLQQIYFLDVFLLYCTLKDSPEMDWQEMEQSQSNLDLVVNQGRSPDLKLNLNNKQISITQWGEEIFEQLSKVATWLDKAHSCSHYSEAIKGFSGWISSPETTFSGQYMSKLTESQLDNGCFALQLAEKYKMELNNHDYSQFTEAQLNEESEKSLLRQKKIEGSDNVSFTEYLENYFNN